MNIDIPQALSIHGSVRFQIIQKHTGTVLFNCHPMKFLCKIQAFLHMVFTQVGDLGVVFYFFLISSLHLADQKIIFLRFQQILQLYRITDILSIVLSLQTASILNQPFRIQTSHFIGGIRDLCIILFQRQLQHMILLHCNHRILHIAAIHICPVSMHLIVEGPFRFRIEYRKNCLCHRCGHIPVSHLSQIAGQKKSCQK